MTQQSRIWTDNCAENTKRGKRTTVSHLARTIVQKLKWFTGCTGVSSTNVLFVRGETKHAKSPKRNAGASVMICSLCKNRAHTLHTHTNTLLKPAGGLSVRWEDRCLFLHCVNFSTASGLFYQQPPCCSQTHKPALKASGTEPSLVRGVNKPPWC